jgi:hypothetical protein
VLGAKPLDASSDLGRALDGAGFGDSEGLCFIFLCWPSEYPKTTPSGPAMLLSARYRPKAWLDLEVLVEPTRGRGSAVGYHDSSEWGTTSGETAVTSVDLRLGTMAVLASLERDVVLENRRDTWIGLRIGAGPALYRAAMQYRPGRSVPTRSIERSRVGALIQLGAEIPFADRVVGIAAAQYRAVGGIPLPSYGVRNDHGTGMVPFTGTTIPLDHFLFALGVGVRL